MVTPPAFASIGYNTYTVFACTSTHNSKSFRRSGELTALWGDWRLTPPCLFSDRLLTFILLGINAFMVPCVYFFFPEVNSPIPAVNQIER